MTLGMSEKTRVVAIVGGVLLLAGGGLGYYIKVHQPKTQRAAAQGEIARWEQRVAAAHTCLFGEKPASARPGEALAVRELSPDPWDRASCTKLVGKLARGVAEDSGLMPVEHAWMSVDRAAAKVASAFALHVGDEPEGRGRRLEEPPLPAALEGLEAARAELRTAAGMDPYVGAGTAVLPVAELVPITAGANRVSALTTWLIPSSGGALAFGSVKNQGEVQLTLVPGEAPKVSKLPPGSLRAVPGLAWGAAGLQSQVAIGPIDDAGAFGAMTSLPVDFGARVLANVGTPANGLVAYAASNQLVIARSTGAAFVADKPFEVGRLTAAMDPAGRALVAWSTMSDEPVMRGFVASDGAPPKILELGAGSPDQSCLTRTAGWIATSEQAISFDAGGAHPFDLARHELVGCTADAAVLHQYGSTHYAVCTDQCRGVDLAVPYPVPVATAAAGKVFAIGARGRVIGVWTEGAAPRFFATAEALSPRIAATNGKVIDVLGEAASGAAIVRIPL